MKKVRGWHGNMGGMVNKWSVAQHSNRTKQLASKDRSDIEGNGHLAWNPARKKNESMKKTSGRGRTNPHNSGTKPKLTREANRKEANNMVNTQTWTWHDAQSSMMHVRFSEAWHGKVQQTTLQIKWSSVCNELHIDETPPSFIYSLPFMYPTILNVVKHGKRWSIMKLPI